MTPVRAADKVVEIVVKCHDINDAQVQRLVLEACLTAAMSSVCDIHRESLLETVYAADSIVLGNHVENSNTARVVIRKIIKHIFTRYERLSEQAAAAAAAAAQAKADELRMAREIVADITDEVLETVGDDDTVLGYSYSAATTGDTQSSTEEKTEENVESTTSSSSNIRTPEMERAYEDCLMVFRALCTLSMKEPESKARESVVEKVLQNKVLTLELLYGVVENAGPRLKTDALFVDNAIKKHLCASLIHNGVSTQVRVFKSSLSLFLSLMNNFRGPLRAEIGVFFSNILLRVLEMPNSNTEQKKLVLALLCHICRKPQSLVDLYINYDCDLNSTDVFSRMVNDLSKIAQGSNGQKEDLRTMALRCIVVILQSLVQWTDEGTTERRRQSLTLARAASPDSAPTATTPELGGGGGGIIIGDEELEQFKEIKQKKQMLEDVRTKWNLNPHRAIEFLRKAGLIDDTPASLAQFLHSVDGLDKKVLGDFLGGSKPFNKDVLREYVECFDFAGMELDEALRYFLGTFLLPGEGQVVDRIMEYFGSRYFRDNNRCSRADKKDGGKERFADADAVYKLSYAIIMLATDLHNPKIKNKLTFDEWVGMVNKDLAMGMDVGYLRAVHDRIAAKKLELNGDGSESGTGADADGHTAGADMLSPKKQQQRFTTERSRWVDMSLQQMQAQQRGRTKEFLHAGTAECVRPIFESIWASTVVALSILLESSDTSEVIELCLQGFKHGIHLACVFFMETQRNTFVTALEKFTLLNNLQEMKPKNIAAIKTLIGISFTEGDYLKGSWAQVLHCVSLLERLHIIATGHKPDVVYEAQPKPTAAAAAAATPRTPEHRRASSTLSGSGRYMSSPSLRASGRKGLPFLNTELADEQQHQQQQQTQGGNGEEEETEVVPQTPFTMEMTSVEMANSRAVSLDIDNTYIDRVFADSIKLSDGAILDFVRALCDESLSEVCSATPRIFSLQKIVEVAYYNMNRIRLVWSEMWIILQQHFIRCGCHEKSAVSMYAIDSLRQLAMKYLEKDELANYNFQKSFLKPFEVVFATTPSDDVKEFIIQCFLPLVTARTKRICSGWKTIFTVLTLAAADGNTRACTQSAFQLAANMSRSCFDIVSVNFFRELCDTLLRFGRNVSFTDVAKGAIEELETCIDRYVVKYLAAHTGESETLLLFSDSLTSLNTWFPVLRGLCDVSAHPHIDVRTAALKVLFSVFSSYGAQFTHGFWELAFRGVLLPLFGSVGYSHGAVRGGISTEWLNTTCLQALQYLVLLLSKFFDALNFLLSDVLAMLSAFAMDTNVDLANIGCTYLNKCVLDNAPRFTPAMWAEFDAVVEHFFNGHNAMLKVLHQCALGQQRASASPVVAVKEKDEDEEKKTTTTTKEEEEEERDKLPEEEIVRCCKVCGKNETVAELIECPMCTGTYYCCEQCQQTDWPTHSTSCLERYRVQDTVPGASTPWSHADCFVVLTHTEQTKEEQQQDSGLSLESVGLSSKSVQSRSDVMRVMLKLLEELVTEQYQHFRTEDLERLADALAGTVTSASAVLACGAAQRALERWQVRAPLLRNEVDAVSFYIDVLFRLFTDDTHADADTRQQRRAYARPRITAVCDALLAQRYRAEWTEAASVSVVLLVLGRLHALADADYVAFLPHYFPSLTALVVDAHDEVRALVQQHLARMTPFMSFALP